MSYREGRTVRGAGRRLAWAAIALAAAVLPVAGCGSALPLGPTQKPAPVPSQLASVIAIQPALIKQKAPAAACPAGYTRIPLLGSVYPRNLTSCNRLTGSPVTITSAAITMDWQPNVYVISITLPAADTAALTTMVTTADEARSDLAVNVAGKTWILPADLQLAQNGQFEILAPTKSQALQFQRILLHQA
jgi:hypothetical protein